MINNSSGRAVTFAFRGSGLTELAFSGTFASKAGNFIFFYAFRGGTQHFVLTDIKIRGSKCNICYHPLMAAHILSCFSKIWKRIADQDRGGK